ncbi:MAG: hypothetical protein QMD09_05165 [Desulfatibacillaceae bacterium]|nr:hypothetical protein [Desulfatibacillaceae bacterium]
MEEAKYTVIFLGPAPGKDPEQVRQNLGILFKKEPRQLGRFFLGKPVTVKENADFAQAEKFRTALEKAGGLVEVEKIEPELSLEDEPVLELDSSDEAAPQVPKMNCPKCGFLQDRSETCAQCGISFADYYRQSQPDEDALPPQKDKDNYPKIDVIYIPPKKTGVKRVIKLLVLLILAGVLWTTFNSQVRERDETPLPNPDATIEELLPRDPARILARSERALNNPWSSRFFLADLDGMRHPVVDELSIYFRFASIAKSLAGAKTLVLLNFSELDKMPGGLVLDAILIDVADKAIRGTISIISQNPDDQHPNGHTFVLADPFGPTEQEEMSLSRSRMITKLAKLAIRSR